jgi:hypothetical protein
MLASDSESDLDTSLIGASAHGVGVGDWSCSGKASLDQAEQTEAQEDQEEEAVCVICMSAPKEVEFCAVCSSQCSVQGTMQLNNYLYC